MGRSRRTRACARGADRSSCARLAHPYMPSREAGVAGVSSSLNDEQHQDPGRDHDRQRGNPDGSLIAAYCWRVKTARHPRSSAATVKWSWSSTFNVEDRMRC